MLCFCCAGVGLGLPGLKPGCSLRVVQEAVAQNDNILTEQQMLRDKIQAPDWEATNEAIEEQVSKGGEEALKGGIRDEIRGLTARSNQKLRGDTQAVSYQHRNYLIIINTGNRS